MRYGLSDKVIEKILNVFRNNSNIQEAVIFGSRAMGNYREGSDIDITLKGNVSFDNLLRIESQIENEMLPYKFDVSLFEKLDNQELLRHINKVGKVIYKKVN
ncbi:nucleotidyltransferase domain-containing protein [Yeosuana sp.]|uniref:nucleotidyltransferase domain-containing protein n=1 Tax=Yeosuana sp. TaxID=2529388 RepID=UPI004054A801|tara:strand:+ start:211 stop:516 length:306 start_codon:yes stop_codon:yes gene_type:complete